MLFWETFSIGNVVEMDNLVFENNKKLVDVVDSYLWMPISQN